MAKKKSDNPFEVRERQFCGELYADNRQHMQALSRLKRNKDFAENFVAIWHIQFDDKGEEIVHEKGKKHCHFILDFENPRYWSAVLKKLGLVDTSGVPEVRFCYPIGYYREYQTFEKGLVYLTHRNHPSKEQYPISAFFGSQRLIDAATRAVVKYESKHISQAECLQAIRKWITSHYGERITPTAFIDWVTKTPFCRSASNPWVYRMIEAHNLAISNAYGEAQMEIYKAGYEKYKEIYDKWISEFEEIV